MTLTDLVGATGLRVTVSIAWRPFREGERIEGEALRKIVYEIDAFACNGGGACPAARAVVAVRTTSSGALRRRPA